jgi:hypothetical protein
MVAQTSIPDPLQAFRPDPERVTEFLDALASPDTSLQEVATAWNTTVGALCLFIESDAGLELLGGIEFALSMRLRITALSALPAVVTTLNTIVKDCPSSDDAASARSDFASLKLIEFKRNNARRAGALLFRMATHQPRAPRRLAITSAQPCGTPKRPLGRDDASDLDPVPPVGGSATTGVLKPVNSSSQPSTPLPDPRLSASVAQTCGTPKRPLVRGEAPTFTSPPRITAPSRASSLATIAGSALPSGP